MPVLVTLGNLNQHTFANSIIAANDKSIELFGKPLKRIEIFHSKESFDHLLTFKLNKETESWIDKIEELGLSEQMLTHRTIEVNTTQESVEEFVNSIEGIVSNAAKKKDEIILDLTNGTTLSKNLLSIAAYVLDIPHQYMIDVAKLFLLTKERGFLPLGILKESYISAPKSSYIDNIAYLSLSEFVRFNKIIDEHTNRYKKIIGERADIDFFKNNLKESIRIKLEGDQRKENTVYRIASSSIPLSSEDLISRLIEKFSPESKARMFGEKIAEIRQKIESKAPPSFDIEFFRKFNDFIAYLRNSTTHKGSILTNIERFKADLSLSMAFPFIQYYTDIVFEVLSDEVTITPGEIRSLNDSIPTGGEKMYYGLDGDDTGKLLEELFFSAKDDNHFTKISNSIKKAISEIRNKIKDKSGDKAIIFEAGDDLLFTGNFALNELESFQGIYNSSTSGLTCSIGYGKSLQEVYLAMKLAKSKPGKGVIIGAEYLKK